MGKCVEKLPHSCGGRTSLQVFESDEGGYNGYCYSCGTYVADPYHDKPADYKPQVIHKTKEEIDAEIDEVKTYPILGADDRGLHKMALEYYGVRTGLSEADGKTPTLRYFPYTLNKSLTAYKVKMIEQKRMWTMGDHKEVDPFGWTQALASGQRKLFITEGEEDAMALFTIIKMSQRGTPYAQDNPAVISVPHGAGNAAKDLARVLPEINKRFKEVVLVFDMDDAGEKAAEEVCRIIPHAARAILKEKDANECLKEGYVKDTFNACYWNAQAPKNSRIIWGAEVHEAAKEPAEWGLSTPWEGLTEITRGIRFGETWYIGAGEKMGKSEIVNALAAHLITEHKLKVMLAKPEEANKKTYKLLVGKVAGKIFHDPKIEFDEDAYEKAGALVKDKVAMLNLYQHLDWDVLKGDMTYAAAQGVKAVFIDPITNLTNKMSSSERNDALMGISEELAAMAADLDIVIFIFCHLNKPAKGLTPWDRGGKITTDYFAGSSAMARSCNYAVGLQGNKDPDEPIDVRNMRELAVLADREFGESGSVHLFWNRENGQFTEMKR